MPAFIRRFALLLCLLCLHCAFAAAAAPAYVVDGDGDAVSDEIDDCPYTHPGVQVNAKGCPLRSNDADVDGVPDDDDDCPYSTPGAVIDAKGCALDSDFDGIADGLDRCARTPLAVVVDALGCPAGEQPAAVVVHRAAPIAVAPVVIVAAPQPLLPPVKPAPARVQQPENVQPVRIKAPASIIATAAASPSPSPVISPPLASPLVVPLAASVAESPRLVVSFNFDSTRMGAGDLAAIAGYAKIFARQIAGSPGSVVKLRAYADRLETEAASTASLRMVVVRKALIAQGISSERIRAENGIIRDGDAGANRRVEAEVRTP